MTKEDPAMKTLQELYDQIKNDDAQKTAFVEAMKAGKAVDFLREQGCDVTAEELQEFLGYKANQLESLELSDSELKDIAGGTIVTEGLASLGETCTSSACGLSPQGATGALRPCGSTPWSVDLT